MESRTHSMQSPKMKPNVMMHAIMWLFLCQALVWGAHVGVELQGAGARLGLSGALLDGGFDVSQERWADGGHAQDGAQLFLQPPRYSPIRILGDGVGQRVLDGGAEVRIDAG